MRTAQQTLVAVAKLHGWQRSIGEYDTVFSRGSHRVRLHFTPQGRVSFGWLYHFVDDGTMQVHQIAMGDRNKKDTALGWFTSQQ